MGHFWEGLGPRQGVSLLFPEGVLSQARAVWQSLSHHVPFPKGLTGGTHQLLEGG